VIEPLLNAFGALPVDALQTLFYALDPFQVIEKFLHFAELPPSDDEVSAFVALEDWLNDGLAMPAAIARTLLAEWYGANTPARNVWQVGGVPIRPADLPHPALALIPTQDRIVPPASALALGEALPNCETLMVETGHIGMVSSRRAPDMVWQPLLEWLNRTFAATHRL
jgi:polyhydroxyalkanoate synthase